MAEQPILSLKDRLVKIVDLSYEILCNKISNGSIVPPNEASLQMQFGVILKQVGQMFEFGKNEHFYIDFEIPKKVENSPKSGSNSARCDILLALSNENDKKEAIIEIKQFLKDKDEAVTDNRFSVILDLKNLELYKAQDNDLLCCEIVYTDNLNYTLSGRSKIELSGTISGEMTYCGTKVILSNSYNANWDCYNNHCFLKINF